MLWSQWMTLLDKASVKDVPKKPGVYMIRCTEPDGAPVSINRVRGSDPEGILYAGETENLNKRLCGLLDTLQPNASRSKHAAGWYFVSFAYDRAFRRDRLQFRYMETMTREEAQLKEFIFLTDYRNEFLDLPPLNNLPGRYPQDWKDIMKKIVGRQPLDE